MFDHQEFQFNSEPYSRIESANRYDFGEDIFGSSSEVVKGILEKEVKSLDLTETTLAKQVREFVYKRENRKKYVQEADNHLKHKQLALSQDYDVILVGAGLHSAIYLYTVKKKNPNLKILIVEKSSTQCSTFYKYGDSLVLNSPTYTKVGLNSNIIQGHFIQVSDFDELATRPFPTGKHLFELATMVLFHADADILFNFEVKDIRKDDDKYILSHQGKSVGAKNLVISNGMGEPISASFQKDRISEKTLCGDDFIAKCYEDDHFYEQIKDKSIAVVGDGDTANCVMEYLLPLVYPNRLYGFYREAPFLPKFVYWIGQCAGNIQEYFFANKTRYCHSGGIIEFFWSGDTPFDLSTEVWEDAKNKIRCVPEKLVSLSHKIDSINLRTSNESLDVDLVIDCTGRFNELSSLLLQGEFEFIEGDIVLYGGRWDEILDRFVDSPRTLEAKRIACKIKGENIFFVGSACPLNQLIDDEEARNGSFKHQEERKSLTNSKWSLEHTLPRTVTFAKKFVDGFEKLSNATSHLQAGR